MSFTFENLYKVYIAVDPQLGPIAIGYHEQLPSVVAWDMRNGTALWNALQENEDIGDLEVEQIAVHGRNVYLALENKLFCVDLATGRQKWAHRFAQKPDGDNGCLTIGDPYPPGTHGAILVPAGEGQWVYALDREAGTMLWEREYDHGVKVETAEGLGTCIVRSDFTRVEILHPESEQPVWSSEIGLSTAKPVGGVVLTVLDDDQTTADGGRNGLLAFDAKTGKELFFDPIEGLDAYRVPCGIQGHVFAVRDEDRGIYAGPEGRHHQSPVSGTLVGHILGANHTLGVLMYAGEGDAIRRFVGLDPETLALKFDTGPIGEGDDDNYNEQVCTDNASFVFLVTTGDSDESELRSIDAATGRVLWNHKCPNWREHYFRNGLLVVHRKGRIDVLFPATGQVVAYIREDD